MAWTEITRGQYDRRGLCYASDCTDGEWALVAPFMSAPSRGGRPRKWRMREVWDAIQYIATTGCQWAMLPKDFPPFTMVQHYFYRLRDSGMLEAVLHNSRSGKQLPLSRNFGVMQVARTRGGRGKSSC